MDRTKDVQAVGDVGTPAAAGGPRAAVVERVLGELLTAVEGELRTRRLLVPGPCGAQAVSAVPEVEAVGEMIELYRRLVFPGFYERGGLVAEAVGPLLNHVLGRFSAHLYQQVQIVLGYVCAAGGSGGPAGSAAAPEVEGRVTWMGGVWPTRLKASGLLEGLGDEPAKWPCAVLAGRVTERVLERLGELRRLLTLDVQAAFDGDPAAEHTDEIILCYPGLTAIMLHRLAHELYRCGVPLLPRMISERAHTWTGIDIHPGAAIGERFFVDHGAGTVIGETSAIGSNVKIYQGVTLGAKSFPKDEHGALIRGAKRHPTLGDRVTIYAGAVILGGDTVIGDDCVINGGVFLTMSVPPGHVVRQKQPELTLRERPEWDR